MRKVEDCALCEISVYPDGMTKAGKPAAGYIKIGEIVVFLRSSKPIWIAYEAKSKVQLAALPDKNLLISFLHKHKDELHQVFGEVEVKEKKFGDKT